MTAAGAGSGAMRSLVLRAWLEPGALPRLRVRVVEVTQSRGEQAVAVTTSADEACRAVRAWLAEVQAAEPGVGGDGTVTGKG